MAQVDWPLANGTTQARVIGKVGEVRYSVRLHRGVDINNAPGGGCSPTNTNCDVHAVNAGYVTWHNPGGNWPHGTSFISVGNVRYIHSQPTTAIQTAGSGTTYVQVGDKIGTMISTGPIHVHLEESNTNYLDQNLDPYIDADPPALSTADASFPLGYKIYRNGITRITPNYANLEITTMRNYQTVNHHVLFSKIDLAMRVEDRGVSATGGVTAGNSTPYAYQYQLQDYTTPDVNNPLYEYLLEFDRAPIMAADNFVLHPRAQGIGARNTMIITSHYRDMPHYRHFNTGIRAGVTETWPANVTLDARHNSEAEFPDGQYRLYMDAYDVEYATKPHQRLANRVDLPVIIDNFLPHIMRVEIATNPNIIKYGGEWTYNNTANNLTFNRYVESDINQNEEVTVRVYPSEKLSELKLKIGETEYVMTETGLYWSVHIVNLPTLNNGINVIRFEGEDITGNQLLTNPSTLPVKMANGNWPNGATTGEDTWHRINIVSGSSNPFFGADFNNGGFCLPQNGNRSSQETDCFQVCFQDNSTPTGDIISWLWDFGDFNNSTSSDQNPSFTYDSSGSYDVTLVITNSNNETSTITKTIVVGDCDSNIQPYIEADVTSGAAPLVVNISDLSIGDISSRQWNISPNYGIQYITGDENSPSISLSFQFAGAYQISLDLEDNFGETVTSNIIIVNVDAEPSTPLYVDFSTEGPTYTGTAIDFNSEVGAGCGGLSYQWTFHDYNGSYYSSVPNTTYTFPVPGVYSVELCVTDNCGNNVCVTKSVNIANYTSNVFAQIDSPISVQNWIVEKNEPVVFYDRSQPSGDILYGSWFFDYQEGASGPDYFYWYPEPSPGTITHTYTEVGTYRVRLYVGENVTHFGSFDEVTITVVDEYDYLEIPTLHESNRQVFTNKWFNSIQTKNFDGYLLTDTYKNYSSGSSTSRAIEIYKRNSSGNYTLENTIAEVFSGNQRRIARVSAYEDKIAVVYFNNGSSTNYSNNVYEIEIYKRNGSDWNSFQLLQTISFDISNTNVFRNVSVNIHENTLAVGHHNSGANWVEIYEVNTQTNLFEPVANFYSSEPAYSNGGQVDVFGKQISITNNHIVVGENDNVNHVAKKHVFVRTDIGWVNAIEDAKLKASNTISGTTEEESLGGSVHVLNDVVLSSRTLNHKGLFIHEKPDSGWANNTESATFFNYQQNIEDYNTGNPNGVTWPQTISDNGNYIIGQGSPIRDFVSPIYFSRWRALVLFYKDGNSWNSKTKEDLRLYPLTVTPYEFNYFGSTGTNLEKTYMDESDNIITQLFTDINPSNPYTNSVLYTYDLTGTTANSGQPGQGICFQNVTVNNLTINANQPGAEGANITIQNMTVNNGGAVIYQATNSIKLLPNTHIKQGSYFRASGVDCNLIDQ